MEKTGTIKMEINKFDGKSNFSLWRTRVKDVLIQQGLIDVLLCDEKPTPWRCGIEKGYRCRW